MILTSDTPINRLGIFFFYDAQGVVDDYVLKLLDGFMPHFSALTIVCNGKLNDAGREKLLRYTSKLIVRENKGFDVWAYKTALDSYGWQKLEQFDEIVLFNATIMGPVYPFSEMFEAMNKRDLDFWGITKFHRVEHDPFGRSPLPLPSGTTFTSLFPLHIAKVCTRARRSGITGITFLPSMTITILWACHESLFTKRFAIRVSSGMYMSIRPTWKVHVRPHYLCGETTGRRKALPDFQTSLVLPRVS